MLLTTSSAIVRGSGLLSSLVLHHQDRFRAFAWIALSYWAPVTTPFEVDNAIAIRKEKTGSEGIGYWKFFGQDDAPALCEKHVSEPFPRIHTDRDR